MALIILSKNIEEIRNKTNILDFQININELIDNQKLIFHLEDEKEEDDSLLYTGNLEKIYFHKEKKFEKLPIIRTNLSSKNMPVLINFNKDFSNKRIKAISNKSIPIMKKNNLNISNSFSSELSLNNLESNDNYSFRNILYSKTINHEIQNNKYNRDSILKLDKVLLNENDLRLSPKIKKRRDSIRMSIFVKNKMQMKHLATHIMKIKKRKKKI